MTPTGGVVVTGDGRPRLFAIGLFTRAQPGFDLETELVLADLKKPMGLVTFNNEVWSTLSPHLKGPIDLETKLRLKAAAAEFAQTPPSGDALRVRSQTGAAAGQFPFFRTNASSWRIRWTAVQFDDHQSAELRAWVSRRNGGAKLEFNSSVSGRQQGEWLVSAPPGEYTVVVAGKNAEWRLTIEGTETVQ